MNPAGSQQGVVGDVEAQIPQPILHYTAGPAVLKSVEAMCQNVYQYDPICTYAFTDEILKSW